MHRKTTLLPRSSYLDELQALCANKSVNVTETLHHFAVVRKLGFPDGVTCWCGDALELKLHEAGQDAKRKAFFDAHEECSPAESEGKL